MRKSNRAKAPLLAVMVRVGGKPFRCKCGANVFTEMPDGTYSCNGCPREYEGS